MDATTRPPATTDARVTSSTRSRPALKLNTFGIPFGVAGLAGTWTAAEAFLGAPAGPADVLWATAAVVWAVALVRYVVRAGGRAAIAADLRDPVFAPFAALVPVTAMLLGARLTSECAAAGAVVVWTAAVVAFVFGSWFTARLLTAPSSLGPVHPGYLLPTVAGGLISAQALAVVDAPLLAAAAFGASILCWMLIGALLVVRFRAEKPIADPLVPTLAIFSAPPAVAGNAWYAMTGSADDAVQRALLGTFLLLVAVQVALLPRYARLRFTLGFWAFTFTTAASATYAVHWVAAADVPDGVRQVGGGLVVGVATAIIGAVAVVSLRAAWRSYRTGGVGVGTLAASTTAPSTGGPSLASVLPDAPEPQGAPGAGDPSEPTDGGAAHR